MIKKDISKVLKEGSPRQRLILLTTDSLQEYLAMKGIKPDAKNILTEGERQNLLDSFKTPQEIKLYNKCAKVNRNFPYFLMMLNEAQLRYNQAIAYLIGFTTSWQDYQFTTQTLNEILYEVKEKKLKNTIKKVILNSPLFTYGELKENNKDGFLELETGIDEKRIRLEGLIRAWSDTATAILIQAKSYIKAIEDYLTEQDFFIQAFKDALNYYEKEFKEDKAIFRKYSKKQMNKLSEEIFYLHSSKLFEKYFVFPDYDELEINEKEYNTILEGVKK